MSMVERAHRRTRSRSGSWGASRTVAAGLAALLMIGVAHQVCFAGGGTAPSDSYDEGLSTGETAAIAIGAAVGVAAVAGAFGGGLGILGGGAAVSTGGLVSATGDAVIAEDLPASCTQLSDIRLIPMETKVAAGQSRMFDLQVRCAEDKKWYSVTRRGDSTIELRDRSSCVVKGEGTKNMFMVPVNASQTCNGQSVVVVGRYAPAGRAAMQSEARILVSVPGS